MFTTKKIFASRFTLQAPRLKPSTCGPQRAAIFHLLFLLTFFPVTGCYPQNQKNLMNEKETVDPFTWDFGKVKEGEVLTHTFLLKNQTSKALNIKNINTSCGCTASEAKKKTLLAQETTDIEVRFKTKGYSGPTQQYIYVNTDDLDNPVIRFIIKADIVKSGTAPSSS